MQPVTMFSVYPGRLINFSASRSQSILLLFIWVLCLHSISGHRRAPHSLIAIINQPNNNIVMDTRPYKLSSWRVITSHTNIKHTEKQITENISPMVLAIARPPQFSFSFRPFVVSQELVVTRSAVYDHPAHLRHRYRRLHLIICKLVPQHLELERGRALRV